LFRLLKASSYILTVVLLAESCKSPVDKKSYIAIYNYKTHGDASIGYAEIIIPVSSVKTHSAYNDSDYSIEKYIKGAELLTSQDTFPLMYVPLKLRNQFFNLSQENKKSGEYSSYIYLFDEPYKWSSLYKMDSIMKPIIKNISEIRYLDTKGKYHVVKGLVFDQPYFFFDGKAVSDKSDKFFQEMYIERPPKESK
jgi:hypothetical protein